MPESASIDAATEAGLAPSALLNWCQDHERHYRAARWLVNVADRALRDPYVAKPDMSAIQVLLIDLKTHSPPGYFDVAAALIAQIPPCYVTDIEKDAYCALVACLRQGAPIGHAMACHRPILQTEGESP